MENMNLSVEYVPHLTNIPVTLILHVLVHCLKIELIRLGLVSISISISMFN